MKRSDFLRSTLLAPLAALAGALPGRRGDTLVTSDHRLSLAKGGEPFIGYYEWRTGRPYTLADGETTTVTFNTVEMTGTWTTTNGFYDQYRAG